MILNIHFMHAIINLLVLLSGCLSRSFCSAEEKIFHKKENLSFKIALKKLGAVQKDKNKQGKY